MPLIVFKLAWLLALILVPTVMACVWSACYDTLSLRRSPAHRNARN